MRVSVGYDNGRPTPVSIERPINYCALGVSLTAAVSCLALSVLSSVAFVTTGNPGALLAAIGFGVISLIAFSSISRTARRRFTPNRPIIVQNPLPQPVYYMPGRSRPAPVRVVQQPPAQWDTHSRIGVGDGTTNIPPTTGRVPVGRHVDSPRPSPTRRREERVSVGGGGAPGHQPGPNDRVGVGTRRTLFS